MELQVCRGELCTTIGPSINVCLRRDLQQQLYQSAVPLVLHGLEA